MKALAALEHILNLHHELARKIVHVAFGLCFLVAAAIFDLSVIPYLAIASLFVFIIVRVFNIFPVMHLVYRRTYGELFYPVGLFAASVIVDTPKAFFVCVAVLAFADSSASLVGKWWKSPSIDFGSSTASLIGSSVFFSVTLAILATGVFVNFVSLWWGIIVLSTITLTAIEAVSPWGSDNFSIPTALALILSASGF